MATKKTAAANGDLEQTQNVVGTAIQFGQQIETALADGFQPLPDIISFIPVLTQIPELINQKDAIKAELAGFDEAKATTLKNYVDTNLVLTNKKVENTIKGAVNVALAIYVLYTIVKPVAEVPTDEPTEGEEPTEIPAAA